MNTWVGQSRWRRGDRSRRRVWITTGPTSSSLRISDWPQVSRSCRAWDQKLSSWFRVPWQRGGLTNLWQRRNQNMRAALRVSRPVQHGKCSFWAAYWRIPFENLSGPHWGFIVNSLTCGGSNAEESARLDKAFLKEFNLTKVTKKKQKIESMWRKSSGEKKKSSVKRHIRLMYPWAL